MKKLVLIFILILLANIALGAKTSDFVKIETDDVNYFTHKDLIDSDYIVGSDKIFYGSKNGNVKLKIFLSEKDAIGTRNFRVGVRSHDSPIKITEVSVDGSSTIIQNAKYEQDFIFQPFINIGKDIEEIEIELEFDPLDVGILEEIDIVLYDQFGNIVAVYDPFISGFNFRQKLTLDTDGIGLGGDITNDHTILVRVPPANDYWTSDTCGDGTGITFAQSDEVTELDFEDLNFALADQNYFIDLEEIETFPSGADLEAWFYYDGTCVDNSDGTGAYPATYDAVFQLDESSAFQDSTAGANNETGSSVTRQSDGIINFGANFNGSNQFVDFGTTLGDVGTGEFTYMIWVNTTTTGVHQHLMGARNIGADTTFVRLYINSAAGKTVLNFGSGTSPLSTTSVANTGWRMITGTRRAADAIAIYIDDTSEANATNSANGTSNNNANFTIGASDDLINPLTGNLDNVKVFDYGLSPDEVKLLFNSDSDNLITFGAEEIAPPLDFNITFNVFQDTGIDFNLTGIDVDFNVGIEFDRTNQTSPFTINDINQGVYEVIFSKTAWDSNTVIVTVDANKTVTILLDKFVYPTIAQFTNAGDFNSTSINYQTIQTFQFETAFGSSSATDVGCSFWTSTNNAAQRNIDYRLQTSEDAADWTTRAELTRTMGANTVASSIFIATIDYNVSDGNHFFRLQQKRDIGADFTISTNDVTCHNFISRDQNSFIISDTHIQVLQSTSSQTFEVISTAQILTGEFNGFIYQYGDLNYIQTVADGNAVLKFELNGFESAEFPRTVSSGSVGIGGHTSIYEDLNRATTYDLNSLVKTSAGTTEFGYRLHLKNLNQRVGEFEQNDLNSITFSSNDFSIINSLDLNLATQGDFRGLAIIPFSCSAADCLAEFLIQIQGGTYDVNSLTMKRRSNGANSIGVAIVQHLFSDVNATDVNAIIWAKTDTGTITVEGGSFSVIHANATTVLTPNPPQVPLVFAPTNGSTVSGGAVDFNCFTTDPNNDALIYDVNIIFRDTNTLALNLQDAGDGNGTFDSNALTNGTYSIECTATESETAEGFSSRFDNSLYSFEINNPAPPVVNITFPNGGESLNRATNPIVAINFNINDPGSGSWLVDLNFSTSSTQGTGVVIAQDLNTQGAGITCAVSSGDANCVVQWTISSVSPDDYFILISVTDEDSLTGFDASNVSFEIIDVPEGEGYERYFAPDDPRKDLVDTGRFVNPDLVSNESSIIRENENQSQMLMGIIILLGVIIIIGIILLFRRKK